MIPISDWLPNALVGLTFTTLGVLKIYGFSKGLSVEAGNLLLAG